MTSKKVLLRLKTKMGVEFGDRHNLILSYSWSLTRALCLFHTCRRSTLWMPSNGPPFCLVGAGRGVQVAGLLLALSIHAEFPLVLSRGSEKVSSCAFKAMHYGFCVVWH